MNEYIAKIKSFLLAGRQSAQAFYSRNRLVVLSGVTIVSILLIVWARLGFTFQFSQFFASQDAGVCGDNFCSTGEVCPADCETGGGTGGGGATGINPGASTASCGSLGGTVCTARTSGGCGAGYTDVGQKTTDCDSGYGFCCKPATAATPTPTTTASSTCGPSIPNGGQFDWSVVYSEPWPDCVEGQSNASAAPTYSVTTNVGTCHPDGLHLVWRAQHRAKATCGSAPVDQEYAEGQGIATSVKNFTNMDLPDGQSGSATMTYTANTAKCGSVDIMGAWNASGDPGVYPHNNAGNTGWHKIINYGVDCGVTTPTPTTILTPTPTATIPPSPTPTRSSTPVPTVTAVTCAPVTQNVQLGQSATLQASGGDGASYSWMADGQAQMGQQVSFTFQSAGTKQVVVTSGSRQATCVVIVGSPQTSVQPSTQPSAEMSLSMTGRNATTGSAEASLVNATSGQIIEVLARISGGTSQFTNVVMRLRPTEAVAYIPGSLTINGIAGPDYPSLDIPVGTLSPGQTSIVRIQLQPVSNLPVGQSQAVVSGEAIAGNAAPKSGYVTISITKSSGTVGQVKTGPGEAVLVALLLSSVVTLLYVSYTHTSVFRRREIGAITKRPDPMDFRS